MTDEKKLNIIIEETAKFFDLKPEYFNLKTNKREFVEPKQIAQKIAKEMTKYSLRFIGESIGGVDHATVLWSIKQVKNYYDIEKRYKENYDMILLRIKNRIKGYNFEVILKIKAAKYRPKRNKIIIKSLCRKPGMKKSHYATV